MKENKNFLRKKRPDPEAIAALLDMYKKCAAVKTLVKTFDLDIRAVQIDNETVFKDKGLIRAALDQCTEQTNNKKQIQMKNNEAKNTTDGKFTNEVNESASKFKNEVEETPQRKFIKLDTEGQAVEGVYSGESQEIKNGSEVNTCHVLKIEEEEFLLPSNVKLNRKLENLKKITGDRIKKGVEVQITYLGMVKIDGVANKMKDFELLTA